MIELKKGDRVRLFDLKGHGMNAPVGSLATVESDYNGQLYLNVKWDRSTEHMQYDGGYWPEMFEKVIEKRKIYVLSEVRKGLRRVVRFLLKHPSKLNMRVIAQAKDGSFYIERLEQENVDPFHCNTVGCLCGWYALSLPKRRKAVLGGREVLKILAQDLGLNPYGIEYKRIIEVGDWPSPFKGNYTRFKTNRAKVKVLAKRVEHLISHGE